MYYEVPGMKLITQDKNMSCWYACGQMIIDWRRRTRRLTELAHPDPSQIFRWSALYNSDKGITNEQIRAFAMDLGFVMVPPMSPTPEAVLSWLKKHGPLWVNGKAHITVIAGIRDIGKTLEVLVFDPDPAYSRHTKGQWRDLRNWYVLDGHSGRDTSEGVQTVFLYAP
jgi:hypothetical protein